jgi:Ca-activated chloride channel family protein
MGLFDFKHIEFAAPLFFWLWLLVPVLIWWRIRSRGKPQAAFKVSSLEGLKRMPVSWKARFRPAMFVCRLLAFILLVAALARPQRSDVTETINSEGIDIVLCLDVSGSMLAQDFHPNRIEAAKKVALDFVEHRPTDRIGLVIFAGESFTQCPITTDHAVLENQLRKVNSGMLEDGTAIGMGLATSVDRLRDSKAKSKVVILLTDGVNNTGLVDPVTALEIAKAYKVRVYTIGVGTQGVAPYPVPMPGGGVQLQNMEVQIDEALLQRIAKETGGQYFRATGNSSLANIYGQIDQMEKTKMEISSYKRYEELFYPLALAALFFLLLEILLRYTVFRSLP